MQRGEEVTQLERLQVELSKHALDANLIIKGSRSYLKVANPNMPELNERVLCQAAEDESLCFWWPWRQPIGSVDDLEVVAQKIAAVLRSVEEES